MRSAWFAEERPEDDPEYFGERPYRVRPSCGRCGAALASPVDVDGDETWLCARCAPPVPPVPS